MLNGCKYIRNTLHTRNSMLNNNKPIKKPNLFSSNLHLLMRILAHWTLE